MFGEEGGDVCTDYADVFQFPASDSVDGVFVVLVGPFDSEEIDVGLVGGLCEEEGALSGADLDMDGSFTSENIIKIKRPDDGVGF